jgi:iron complex transport system substrate-binding protein
MLTDSSRLIYAVVFLVMAWAGLAGAADAPRRIASFNVCADQLVMALADPDQIVGLSPYASDPNISVMADTARRYPRLALQAEAMVPLKPDLILVGTWDRPLTQRMLRTLGFRVVGVDLVSDIAEGVTQIRDVAALVGHPERGEALVAQVSAARRRLADAPRPPASTAMLVGSYGYTVGPKSLAGALLAEAGLKPPPGTPSGLGGYVPLEKLIMLQPDYLVVERASEAANGQGALYLRHPALRDLYPTSRRILLPSRYTLCAGPGLVAALDYLATVVTRLAASP